MSGIKSVIASRLRDCRKSKGWTLKETVEPLGWSPSRFSSWELEVRTPGLDELIVLADRFGTSPAYLAGFTDHEGRATESMNFVSANQATITVKDAVLTLEQVVDTTALKIDYIKRRGLNENKLTTILAPDNSMADEIKQGDELLIDRTQTKPKTVDIFAIMVNGSVWIRWIRPEIDGTFTIAAEDSAHYPDIKMSSEEIEKLGIIGRVARFSRDR